MRKSVSKSNPFGPNRYGFLWEVLGSSSSGKHLDYGSYDGRVLDNLARTVVIEEGVGVDLNSEVTIRASGKMPSNIRLVDIEKGAMLPFEDSTFDTVSILDVIEHIHDQRRVLAELNRVLKPKGKLIVTVPRRNFFSFLDTGNIKFVFPRIHRFLYEFSHSKEEYRTRYIECRNGLFGDIEKEKMWHQHFSEKELESLLDKCGFRVNEFDGSGLFTRPLYICRAVFPFLEAIMDWFIKIDFRVFHQSNLFSVSEKVDMK
jgi:SAM-dependent methyltransferase